MRIAKDLGIRYADVSAGRLTTPEWRRAQMWCTERSLATIGRVHGVSRMELTAVSGDRELWIDLVVVFLPVLVLMVVADHLVAVRVVAEFDARSRGIAAVVLAALAPLVAGVGVVMAQLWGAVVEQLRLRNEHISYRAFELPASRHGWWLWSVALSIFVAIGARALLRQGEYRSAHGLAFRWRSG